MDHHFSGTLSFKGCIFSFAFDGKRLSLFPLVQEEKESIEYTWLKEEIKPGVFAGPRFPEVDTDYLTGTRNEDGHTIVFLVNKRSRVSYTLSLKYIVLYVRVHAYIDRKYERNSICKVSFSCPEINLIHPANQAFELKLNPDEWSKRGKASITSTDFDASQTSKRLFRFKEAEVATYFAISRSVGDGINHPAIAFTSNLVFEFKPTNNFRFICELCFAAEQFIQYLCYRTNIRFSEIKLSAPYNDGTTEPFATMHLLWQPEESESRAIEKRRLIGQSHIEGREGVILEAISSGALYMRHIPPSYNQSNQITPASFLMLVAAFEWEFDRIHPEGVTKSDARINAENHAEEKINNLIDESSGKEKDIYRFLRKLIRNDSLKDKFKEIENDVVPSIGKIGQALYKREGIDFNFVRIGERIASQRNAFAHGNLSKSFNKDTLVDIGFLKIIVYAMQLKNIGLDEDTICSAIEQLFGVSG